MLKLAAENIELSHSLVTDTSYLILSPTYLNISWLEFGRHVPYAKGFKCQS